MAFVDMALQFNPQSLANDVNRTPTSSSGLPQVYLGDFRAQLLECANHLSVTAWLDPRIELPDNLDLHITNISQDALDYLQNINPNYKLSDRH